MTHEQGEHKFGQDEPKRFAYFDTNVISRVSRGEVENFLPLMQRANVGLVVSDITVSELKAGNPSGELQFIIEHGFFQILAHEPLFDESPITFYRTTSINALVELSRETTEADALERFLVEFFRSASGSKSVAPINTLLAGAATSILDDLANGLPEGTDPRIVASYEAARARVSGALEQLPALSQPLITKAEATENKFGPLYLGNLKPPGIVRQIYDQVPQEEKHHFSAFVEPIRPEENIRERVQVLCQLLALAGFGRDSRIGNDSEKKSLAGAQAQFNDFYHIAAAAGMDAFLTSDVKAAKLAFAAYEHFNIKTMIVHVTKRGNAAHPIPVCADYWP